MFQILNPVPVPAKMIPIWPLIYFISFQTLFIIYHIARLIFSDMINVINQGFNEFEIDLIDASEGLFGSVIINYGSKV